MPATVVNFCGWETGDALEANDTSGTFAVQNTVKRTGDYALRVNPTTTAVGYNGFRNLAADGSDAYFALDPGYFTFYFRVDTLPSATDEPIFQTWSALQLKLEVRVNSAGKLAVYNTSSALVATGATVLATDGTWYRIDVESAAGNPAAYEVRINGTSELSGTCNQNTSAVARIYVGKATNRNGKTVDFYYDDLVVCSGAYYGTAQVTRMDIDGQGTYTAWTGTYADIDEVPHDGDTTKIDTATAGNAETGTLESATSAGVVGAIAAVKSIAITKQNAGGATISVRLRSGATDSDTASRVAGAVYQRSAKFFLADPADAAAWTAAKLNALEVGVVANANASTYCTAAWVIVLSNGVAAAATSRSFAVII